MFIAPLSILPSWKSPQSSKKNENKNANCIFTTTSGDICKPETQYSREGCQGERRSERGPGRLPGSRPQLQTSGHVDRATLSRVSDLSHRKTVRGDAWANSRCPGYHVAYSLEKQRRQVKLRNDAVSYICTNKKPKRVCVSVCQGGQVGEVHTCSSRCWLEPRTAKWPWTREGSYLRRRWPWIFHHMWLHQRTHRKKPPHSIINYNLKGLFKIPTGNVWS